MITVFVLHPVEVISKLKPLIDCITFGVYKCCLNGLDIITSFIFNPYCDSIQWIAFLNYEFYGMHQPWWCICLPHKDIDRNCHSIDVARHVNVVNSSWQGGKVPNMIGTCPIAATGIPLFDRILPHRSGVVVYYFKTKVSWCDGWIVCVVPNEFISYHFWSIVDLLFVYASLKIYLPWIFGINYFKSGCRGMSADN